jgi:hypothetical protein
MLLVPRLLCYVCAVAFFCLDLAGHPYSVLLTTTYIFFFSKVSPVALLKGSSFYIYLVSGLANPKLVFAKNTLSNKREQYNVPSKNEYWVRNARICINSYKNPGFHLLMLLSTFFAFIYLYRPISYHIVFICTRKVMVFCKKELPIIP